MYGVWVILNSYLVSLWLSVITAASNGSSSSQPIATLSNTSNGSNLHTDVDRPQPEQATLPMAAPFDLTPAMREGMRVCFC